METIFIYLVKSIGISLVFWLYYVLFLRGKEFHQYNRFYLLLTTVLSLILPLIKVNWFTIEPNNQNLFLFLQYLNGNSFPESIAEQTNSWWYLLAIPLLISLFLLFKFLISIFSLNLLKKQYPSQQFNDYQLIITDLDAAPFTFLSNLFWKKSIDLNSSAGQKILQHELAHIHQKHTWDRLLMQSLKSIFWFNPILHKTHQELILIHEYLADQKAIQNKDSVAFAEMLLNQHYGPLAIAGTSPFFNSTIKKRLEMLTKNHKTSFTYARRIWALPLLFIVTFTYLVQAKNKEIVAENSAIESLLLTDEVIQQLPVHDSIKARLAKQKAKLEKNKKQLVKDKIESEKLKVAEARKAKEIEAMQKEVAKKTKELEKLLKKDEKKLIQKNLDAKLAEIDALNAKIDAQRSSLDRIFLLSNKDLAKGTSIELQNTENYFNSKEWKNAQKQLKENLQFFQTEEGKNVLKDLTKSGEGIRLSLAEVNVDEILKNLKPLEELDFQKFELDESYLAEIKDLEVFFNSDEWKNSIKELESLKGLENLKSLESLNSLETLKVLSDLDLGNANSSSSNKKTIIINNPDSEWTLQKKDNKITTNLDENIEYRINGKSASKAQVEALNPVNIESVNVFKEVNKNGRIEIITK